MNTTNKDVRHRSDLFTFLAEKGTKGLMRKLREEKEKSERIIAGIDNLMPFIRGLVSGREDPNLQMLDPSPQSLIRASIYGSKILIDQMHEGHVPSTRAVVSVIDLFDRAFQKTMQLSLADEVTMPYAQFIFTLSNNSNYELPKRKEWLQWMAEILLITACAKRDNPLFWVLYGRSQYILSYLYQGVYSIIILKHALQKLAKVDFIPDVKVMMGIFYAELAMLVYEDHRPHEGFLPYRLTEYELEEAKKLEFIDMGSLLVMRDKSDANATCSEKDSKSPTEETKKNSEEEGLSTKRSPGSYAKLLWDSAVKGFWVRDSVLLNADLHYCLCLGRWALMYRDSWETDILLNSARQCLSFVSFEEVIQRASEDEWWADIKEQIEVLFSASVARIEDQDERKMFLMSLPKELRDLIANENDKLDLAS